MEFLRVQLSQELKPNGKPVEALYAAKFTLADRGQVLDVTEQMLDTICSNFETLGESGRIPIHINHNAGNPTLESGRAVGWIIRFFLRSKNGRTSLMFEPKWLDDAKKAIEAQHYKFVSVGLRLADKHPTTGEDIGPHALEVSLCTQPAIPGLEPIELSAKHGSPKLAGLRHKLAELRHKVERLQRRERTNMSEDKSPEVAFWDLCDQALRDNPKLTPGEARKLVALEHRHLAELAQVPGARRGRKGSEKIENSDHYRDEFFRLSREIEQETGCSDIESRGRVLRQHPSLRDAAFGTDARTRFFGAAKYEVETNRLDLAQSYRAVALHLASDAMEVL